MSETVGDQLLGRLAGEWGVKRIYGYPGDGINGVMGALRTGRDRGPSSSRCATRRWPRSWPAPTRSSPARSASAWRPPAPARSTCSTASTTPSSTTSRSSPSSASRRARRSAATTSRRSTCVSLFKDVAHEFVEMATEPAQVRHLVDRAVRIALAERTVTCVILPNDVQEADAVEAPPRKHGTVHSGPGLQRPARRAPREQTCGRAAEILNAGEKVAMLIGAGRAGRPRRGDRGRRRARRRRRQGAARQGGAARRPALGDRLDRPARDEAELGPDAGMRHAADGRLELPLLGVPARRGAGARRADRHRRTHARHPLPDGGQPGRRQRRDAARAAAAARAQGGPLAGARRSRRTSRSWWQPIERARRGAARTRSTRSGSSRELSKRLPDGAIITADSGSSANWYARDVKLRPGHDAPRSPATLATMGRGVPYAIAAKFAHPRPRR